MAEMRSKRKADGSISAIVIEAPGDDCVFLPTLNGGWRWSPAESLGWLVLEGGPWEGSG
jgi:hypothetical protein